MSVPLTQALGDTQMHTSALAPDFIATVEQWLSQRGEILVIFRYPNAGGARDYELHRSLHTLKERLSSVPSQTSVIAFQQTQLPLRGVVDSAFIDAALAFIPNGNEFLLVETVLTTYGKASWYRNASGMMHSELKEELEESLGRPVLLGAYPPWLHDGPSVISGYVPDSDGRIQPGAY